MFQRRSHHPTAESVHYRHQRSKRSPQRHNSTKVSPYRDVNNEGAVKEDQLALDVKDLNLNEQATRKKAHTFRFQELSNATGNFRSDYFLGEGGFGKVFKGKLEKLDQLEDGIHAQSCPLVELYCSLLVGSITVSCSTWKIRSSQRLVRNCWSSICLVLRMLLCS